MIDEVYKALLIQSQEQAKELLEMLKKSNKLIDELSRMLNCSNSVFKNDPELFIRRRIDYIRNSSLYEKLSKDPAIIIHIIPEDFQANKMSDLKLINKDEIVHSLVPHRASGADYCFNADGFMVCDDLNNIKYYNLMLRNEALESFTYLRTDHSEPSIFEAYFLNDLNKIISDGIQTLNKVFKSTKFKVYISLNQVQSVRISRINGYHGPFKIDNLYLPEIELSSTVTPDEIKTALKYPLQIMYQSCNTRYL